MNTASNPDSIAEHAAIAAALRDWFRTNARDLPWRRVEPESGRRDPYRSLVSELMLQQTQVNRVLEKFGPFMDRFPTIESLAAAGEQDVLAAWSGLGYYRRARLLHGAAKDIVRDHAGRVPASTDKLLAITGIGPYTAGAIASIVFGKAAPIVDGNVSRVLMRLRADERPPGDRGVVRENWADARGLAEASEAPGESNEGLMELGALVCTPRAPRCDSCPLREVCKAAAMGLQDRIPGAKKQAVRSTVYHTGVHIRDDRGRVLAERRPASGLWASMWQAPTAESERSQPRPSVVLRRLGLSLRLERAAEFVHITSHREVVFRVYRANRAIAGAEMDALVEGEASAAIALSELDDYALSNPHRRILSGSEWG